MKKKILYFYTNPSSFVNKDIEILGKEFAVSRFEFNVSSKFRLPLIFFKQSFFLFFNISSASLLIIQFGGYHSFFPVLFAHFFKRKSLIITGGVDCVSYPSFNYGYLHKFPLGSFTKMSYRLASHISPKHESLIFSMDTYYGKDSAEQGIKHFIPDLKTPITVIHNGYNGEKWRCISAKKKNSFITICGGWEYSFQKQLKGIDLIFEVAKFFQDCEFIIVGVPAGENAPSSNIHFIPPQINENLLSFYSESEFCFQLSISEGFPNALCEAMLCECIPIVSDVGAMPEITGDSGFILKKRDVLLLKNLVESALESDRIAFAKKARQRILEYYPIEKREKKLIELAERLAN